MTHIKNGSRFVVIGRAPPAGKKTGRRELPVQRALARRIVVIRDGELVGGRPGR
jgi:hypothetical protein